MVNLAIAIFNVFALSDVRLSAAIESTILYRHIDLIENISNNQYIQRARYLFLYVRRLFARTFLRLFRNVLEVKQVLIL